ncbi:MAG TPA: hypothetical protein VGI95_17760 [Caulobacteraceae bacterium]|jgi:hypothetical protein
MLIGVPVSINGAPAVPLDAKLARNVRVKRVAEVVEGVVLNADQAVERAKRRMAILYTVAFGIAGAIALAGLLAAAAYEPSDLGLILPLVLVLSGGLGWAAWWAWRRNVAKAQARAEASLERARLAAPGVSVRVDAMGVSVGGTPYPWSGLTVQEIGVTVISVEDGTAEFVDRLTLSGGGRTLVLDSQVLSEPKLVAQAWRRLCAQHGL